MGDTTKVTSIQIKIFPKNDQLVMKIKLEVFACFKKSKLSFLKATLKRDNKVLENVRIADSRILEPTTV